MQVPRPRRGARAARSASQSVYATTIDVLFTGVAVVVPLVITVYVLKAAYDFLVDTIDPFVRLVNYVLPSVGLADLPLVGGLLVWLFDLPGLSLVSQFASLLVMLGVIGFVGILARNRYGEHLIESFEGAVMAVPGIGSVYKSFRRMSDVMMESDASNFQDVKLVEFPYRDVYVIGFVTNDTPPAVEEAAGEEEMQTLFLPLAPNPFMGGHLTNVPTDRILDVDMTVEEGVRTIITTGIATPQGDGDEEMAELGVDDLPTVESLEELVERERERVRKWEERRHEE
ncbi:MAG: DUF502 domain-containing protein [Halobacteriaceae archaeon]